MRSAAYFAVPLLVLASACTYDNGHVRRVGPSDYSVEPAACAESNTPVQSRIDADSKIDVDAGQGAGLFVEYASGGHWLLRTSCDTLLNRTSSCEWDVIVTPEDGASISNVAASGLEGEDRLALYSDNSSYQLLAVTSSDIDGFTFDSPPGSAIRVDAYLDRVCAVPYFYWVGDGALHTGSPTNPLDLLPSRSKRARGSLSLRAACAFASCSRAGAACRARAAWPG